MATGVALILAVVVLRRVQGAPVAESYQEVAARGSAWTKRRVVSAGAGLSALIGSVAIYVGVLSALWKTVPAVIIVVGSVYGLMVVVALTAGRHRTIDPPRNWWERFVDLCNTVAWSLP
jgi:hypothetical protein